MHGAHCSGVMHTRLERVAPRAGLRNFVTLIRGTGGLYTTVLHCSAFTGLRGAQSLRSDARRTTQHKLHTLSCRVAHAVHRSFAAAAAAAAATALTQRNAHSPDAVRSLFAFNSQQLNARTLFFPKRPSDSDRQASHHLERRRYDQQQTPVHWCRFAAPPARRPASAAGKRPAALYSAPVVRRSRNTYTLTHTHTRSRSVEPTDVNSNVNF